MSLATCPVCRCVVDGQVEHATAWHAPIAQALAFTTASADLPQQDGGRTWGGPPVAQPPQAPTVAESTLAATRRERARAAVEAVANVLPDLDAYLETTSPSAAQVSAQVRLLTRIARALLLTVRDLVRLTVRALED